MTLLMSEAAFSSVGRMEHFPARSACVAFERICPLYSFNGVIVETASIRVQTWPVFILPTMLQKEHGQSRSLQYTFLNSTTRCVMLVGFSKRAHVCCVHGRAEADNR